MKEQQDTTIGEWLMHMIMTLMVDRGEQGNTIDTTIDTIAGFGLLEAGV